MSLAPFDVLVSIIAARVRRFFDGLDTLGVHNGRCWLGILAYSLPLGRTHGFEDKGPQSGQSEPSEVVVNGRPRRKVMGQKPPMAATSQNVEDGVENIAQGVGAGSSLGFRSGQIRSQTGPYGIAKVGRIRLSHRRERTKPS